MGREKGKGREQSIGKVTRMRPRDLPLVLPSLLPKSGEAAMTPPNCFLPLLLLAPHTCQVSCIPRVRILLTTGEGMDGKEGGRCQKLHFLIQADFKAQEVFLDYNLPPLSMG